MEVIMKKLFACLVFLSGVCASLTGLAADNPLPDDPAGRWDFFKANYHAMPAGLKVCLIIIALLIIASISYYKLTDKKHPAADKPAASAKADGKEATTKGGKPNGK